MADSFQKYREIAASNRAFLKAVKGPTPNAWVRRFGWCPSCKLALEACECASQERPELDFEADP